jgi:LruC domain-containing protein
VKLRISNFIKSFLFIFLLHSCGTPDIQNDSVDLNNTNTTITNKTFDFSTYRQVKITINDDENLTKYDVYAYSEETYFAGNQTFLNESNEIVTEPVYKNDILNKLIVTGVPINGVLVQTISVPTYCTKLYVRRNNNLNFSASIVSINNGEVVYTHTKTVTNKSKSTNKSSATTLVKDYLYCVNSSAELFLIDPLNGKLTYLSDMPMGSVTCAIDQANKCLYSVGNNSPYPLMKYSIATNSWTTVKNIGTGGPRLDFNTRDGLLYLSNVDKIYTINPTSGALSAPRTIKGLHDTNGGDLAFAKDGTLFLCSFSGLYRLELDKANVYQSTRISADNLPFQPTSMTFDSQEDLWLANNASSSDLIVMDIQTGGWKYVYGTSAKNNTDYKRTINDLTTFRVYTTVETIIDSDGDGVQDQDDASPLDPNVAFELFTPSKYGNGTIAFEDLWPSYGDYDFNDVALNYKVILKLNAQNLAVQMDLICNVKSNGAGFTNGIGIEIGNLLPSQIKSVTGTVLTENYITVNPNGTEASQQHAVIILTDAAKNLLAEHTISIKFTKPLTTLELGTAPFNPFIIANKERKKEIHLPYSKPTSLGDSTIKIVGTNRDISGNYVSDEGMPWAISFLHDFKVPKEKVKVTDAYNYFVRWANSGGTDNSDWYKDNPGNRNLDKIQN